MSKLPKVTDLEVAGKQVLVRADLDVPLLKLENKNVGVVEYAITDGTRLELIAPTIKLILAKGAKSVIVAGHIGHSTQTDGGISTFVLLPTLGGLVGEGSSFWGEAIKEGKMKIETEEDGRVHLLENLRMYPGEESNDSVFAERLASFGEVYVNEAFAVSHRGHASIVGVPRVMREQGKPVAVGLRFAREVKVLSKVLEEPKRPLIVVVGGAKIESKLPVIAKMEAFADRVLVGGKLCSEIAAQALTFSDKVWLASLAKEARDIDGPSAQKFSQEIGKAGTVVWSGPMGVFEAEGSQEGTFKVASAIAGSKALKIAGGGDTELAIRRLGLVEKFDWISIGGGAMLEFLAKGTLPGIQALIS